MNYIQNYNPRIWFLSSFVFKQLHVCTTHIIHDLYMYLYLLQTGCYFLLGYDTKTRSCKHCTASHTDNCFCSLAEIMLSFSV